MIYNFNPELTSKLEAAKVKAAQDWAAMTPAEKESCVKDVYSPESVAHEGDVYEIWGYRKGSRKRGNQTLVYTEVFGVRIPGGDATKAHEWATSITWFLRPTLQKVTDTQYVPNSGTAVAALRASGAQNTEQYAQELVKLKQVKIAKITKGTQLVFDNGEKVAVMPGMQLPQGAIVTTDGFRATTRNTYVIDINA